MDRSRMTVGVAIPAGSSRRWQEIMLESLGQAGLAVDAGVHAPPEIPAPWGGLLGLERLFNRKKPDLLARRSIPTTALASLPEHARPDLLVLPPGSAALPEFMERCPLGVLEIEPVHPARMGRGVLEGRMVWRRPGSAPRLAASAFTSQEGPEPLGWAGPHLAKAALMPSRFLARLEREGVETVWNSLPEVAPLPPFAPDARDWLKFLAELAGWGLTRAWQDIFHRRQWFLATRRGDGDPARPGFSDRPFTPLHPPGRTGWADPFLFEKDGRSWLFIEEIPFGKRGVISVLERLPGGGYSQARRVLEEPFHLSYPNVFEHEGQTYMMPETSEAGQVRLYRATDFPGGWVLDRVLLTGASATDATLVEHGGKWWMFVNLRADGGSSWDELHLFEGESRLGPFHAHPANPVVSDVRRARPAGRFLRRGGKLYRPAQDCSGWYGRALEMMEVTRLDGEAYEEKPAGRLTPGLIQGSFCLHALDADGALEVVDGQRRVPIWR